MPDIIVTEFCDPAPLKAIEGEYAIHVDMDLWQKRAELEALAADAIAIIVRNRTQVDADLIAKAPKLRAVGRLGVGLDNIDVATCKAKGIAVCPAVGANAVSVAEYVMATALMFIRGSSYFGAQRIAAGEWPREEMAKGREVGDRRMGIIGFGSVGQTVGRYGAALGMEIVAFDDFVPADSPAWGSAKHLGLDELLSTSDVVTLHCPLTPETRGLIGEPQLRAMRKDAILINTARGGIVDEAALASVLKCGHLTGAAIDVFDVEPIKPEVGALFAGIPNVILTPHIAGVTEESNDRISKVTVANVVKALKGST